MKPDIIEFVTDPQLLGLTLSPAQETLLRVIYGLPLTAEQRQLFQHCTGRTTAPPPSGFGEVTVVAGARGGKDSRIAAPIAVYEALFGGHDKHLARGERAMVPLVAQDARAAVVAFGYVSDYLLNSPLLRAEVEESLASSIKLRNRVTIATFPCTLASLRGWSVPAAVMDELAFYRLEGRATSDVEIQASIRRGGVTFPHPRLVKISTPYMRAGVIYDDLTRAFGHDDPDLLAWKASSLLMNPTLTAERLERERRLDPQRFAREYEAEFDASLVALFDPDALEACVVSNRREIPPDRETWYAAFVDPSGGRSDAFTLAIGHRVAPHKVRRPAAPGSLLFVQSPVPVEDVPLLAPAGGTIIIDACRRWPSPLDPAAVTEEAAVLLQAYGIRSVSGDRYGGEWPREAFRRAGIGYHVADAPKSDLYLALLPLVNAHQIELPDNATLLKELRLLERRRGASGRDRVDHPLGGHDDVANAVAGVASLLPEAAGRRRHKVEPPPPETTQELFNRRRREIIERTIRLASGASMDGNPYHRRRW